MKNRILKWIADKLFKSSSFLYDSVLEYESVKKEQKEFRFTFKWWLNLILKILILIVIIIITLHLFGCSSKAITNYEHVYVPVKCEVKEPAKPKPSGDIIKDNLLILKYSDELKVSLKKCLM